MNEKTKTLAKEWFDSALSDYGYAEVGLKEQTVYPQVAFLSQQVAEKLLKAFLVANGKELSRIHDLPKLLDECARINPDLEKLRDACELLTGFYIETRYPPDIPEYAKADINQAFEQARIIKETIKKLLGPFFP